MTFTWAVDKFATAPSFIQVSNTSNTVTVDLSPTATNVGTYQITFTFTIGGKPPIFAKTSMIIDVYPSAEYGSEIPDIECASKVTPAIFEKSGVTFKYSDMDSTGAFYLICGYV